MRIAAVLAPYDHPQVLRTLALALSLVFALVPRALAQSTEASAPVTEAPATTITDDDAEARGLFDAGERAFAAGHYERALEHFRRSYELSGRDALLYNIALSADRLRRDAEALEAFEAYLASPEADPALRVQVEARVAILRESTAEEAPAPAEPPPDTTGAVVVLVVGAVLVAGSAVLFGAGAAENDAVQNAPMGSAWADYAGRQEAANGLFTAGGAAAGIGIGMVAVGSLVLAAVSSAPRSAESPSAELIVGPGSLGVRGAF